MRKYTTERPWSAIAAASFFAGVTAWVLFSDVIWHGAPFTTKHVMTLAVLVGTMFFGHYFGSQALAWRVVPAIGCAVLFLGGTYMCVFMATGRNAEAIETKNAAARKHNTGRTDLETETEAARKQRDTAKAQQQAAVAAQEQADKALQTACGSKPVELPKNASPKSRSAARADLKAETEAGKVRCDGATRAADLAAKRVAQANSAVKTDDEHYWDLVGRLANTDPARVENGDVKAFASAAVKLPWVQSTAEAIEATHVLLLPIGMALFAEIGMLVSLSIRVRVPAAERSVNELADTSVQSPPRPPVDGGSRKLRVRPSTQKQSAQVITFRPRVEPKAKGAALAYVQAELAAGREFPEQNDLADRVGVTKGAVSKWAKEWEAADLISRTRVGRRKVIGGK